MPWFDKFWSILYSENVEELVEDEKEADDATEDQEDVEIGEIIHKRPTNENNLDERLDNLTETKIKSDKEEWDLWDLE